MPQMTRRIACLVPLLLLAVGLAAPSAPAQDAAASGPKASVELLVPKKTVKPGETLDVAVKMTLKPGWHIYWKNPGDSGQPPKFSWSLPGGGASAMMRGSPWKATDPQFPTPVRWQADGGIVGYGYTGTILFPATVSVPASATPGQGAELAVAVDYLICKDVCIPENAGASVNLDVGLDDGEQTAADKAAAKEIEQAKKRLPAEAASAPTVTRDGTAYTVQVGIPATAKNLAFFPDAPAGLSVEDVKVQQRDGNVTVKFTARPLQGAAAAAGKMPAVLGYDAPDGQRRGVSLSVPLDAEKTKP